MENLLNNLPKKYNRKNRYYDTAERSAFIESWKHSGLNYRIFCRQKNISPSTFYHWIQSSNETKSKNQAKNKSTEKKFMPVKVVPGKIFDGVVEIKLSNGIEIKFSEQTSIALIGNLIKELQS